MLNSYSIGATANPVSIIKNEARLLHKAAEKGDDVALYRIRRQCPAFIMGAPLQRKHCLATVGRELGFSSWKAARDCFVSGDISLFDTFLHPSRCHVHWNIWFADLNEARKVRAENGGYLLVYKNQYIVVDRDYIASLGVDPDNAAWNKIDRDWTAPDTYGVKPQLITAIMAIHFKSVVESAQHAVAAKLGA